MGFAEGLNGFGRIHHRVLNDIRLLENMKSQRTEQDGFTEIAEGDLCWYVDGKNVTAVFIHPIGLNAIPSYESIKRREEKGAIVRLKDILERRFDGIPFVVELKTGAGSTTRALEYILAELETHARGRYWVDSFSPSLLAEVKMISPGTPTSLHTRLGVYGPLFVRTSFDVPPIGFRSLSALSQADAITVTYKYSPARFLKSLGATIDNIHAHVAKYGKRLVMGGVETREIFAEVQRSSAVAAYVKWK